MRASIALAPGVAVLIVLVLWAKPPDLLRVGANYTAKIVCSNAFLTDRDPGEVLNADVQAPGHPLLKLMRVRLDRTHGVVRAGLFGFIGDGLAVAVPGQGCVAVSDGVIAHVHVLGRATGTPRDPAGVTRQSAPPPRVASDEAQLAVAPPLQRIAQDDALAGPGVRAVLMLHQGRIVAERYAAGFSPDTVQLGWSMTKSVVAGLIGLLVQDGRLRLDAPAGWIQRDGRELIKLADLLSMTSGLEFNENRGTVSDLTRMLYLEPNMNDFARGKPLARTPGTVWSYSSGTAVMLSKIFQDGAGDNPMGFVQDRLFKPLGMTSATLEADESGTLVGSSYMYATPRDWARYAQLLCQDGIWNGLDILPRGYVATMSSPVPASGGEYGRGMVWRWVTHSDQPGVNPDAADGIPLDTFWMAGHDGQYAAIIPSQQVVIVRMGLTPSRLGYRPEPLVSAMLHAMQRLSDTSGDATTPPLRTYEHGKRD